MARLTAEAATVPTIPHPRIAEAYRRRVETLELALGEGSPEAQEALDLVRGLIERVTIVPDGSAPDGIWLEIEGDLAELLVFSVSGQAKAPKAGRHGGCATVSGCGDPQPKMPIHRGPDLGPVGA